MPRRTHILLLRVSSAETRSVGSARRGVGMSQRAEKVARNNERSEIRAERHTRYDVMCPHNTTLYGMNADADVDNRTENYRYYTRYRGSCDYRRRWYTRANFMLYYADQTYG